MKVRVKCKCCGKYIFKDDAIRVYDNDGYFCYCSKECLTDEEE